jgi:hypothetical protein
MDLTCTNAGTATVYVQTPERNKTSLNHMNTDEKRDREREREKKKGGTLGNGQKEM